MVDTIQFPNKCIDAKIYMISEGLYICDNKTDTCNYRISTLNSNFCAIELERYKQAQKELSDKIRDQENLDQKTSVQ